MKSISILRSAGVLVACALGLQTASAQEGISYTNGAFNLALGTAYRVNLGYAHSYVGFNIKPLPTGEWTLGTDGGSNGGSMIVGNMGGGLRIITVSGANPSSPQTLNDNQLASLTRFEIDPNGQVRIGSKLPGTAHMNYRLAVDGKLVTQSLYVTNPDTWADFVFAPTYRRMPLVELETYLQRNKHLPAIPAASEVIAQGYNVSEMDAKLLQSIEELTLHVIELNKQVQQLKAEKAAASK